MATPSAVRAALASVISANVAGLRGQTDPEQIANPPVAIVLPAQGTYINYAVSLEHGVWEVFIRVVILVSRASMRAGIAQLDGYLAPGGTASVPAAILKDPTLGGVTDFCVPVQATAPIDISWAGVDYLGAEIICQAGAE